MFPPGDRTDSQSYYPRFRRSDAGRDRTTAVPASGNSETVGEESTPSDAPSPAISLEEIEQGLEDYARLKRELYWITLVLTGLIFATVWFFYALDIALNYAIGALVGLAYLRLLAKNVDRLSAEDRSMSKSRLAVFVVAILFASQVDRLQILPIFLGFLTYKATLIVYTVRVTLLPETQSSGESQSSTAEESS